MRTEGTISMWGNGRAVRIPKLMLDNLGLRDNDTVEIIAEKNAIMIKPTTKKYLSIKERVENFYQMDFDSAVAENPYSFEEVDFGKPEGDEIW